MENTVADGILRWESEDSDGNLHAFRPDVAWSRQVLANGRRAMLKSVGGQFIRQPVAPSSHRAYAPGFRPRAAFRGVVGEAEYFGPVDTDTGHVQALLELVAWCVSEGNQASTIAGKLFAVLHFYRVDLQWSCLRCRRLSSVHWVARSHVAARTPKRVRSLCRGMQCWKQRAWPRPGVRAAALFDCLSR